MRLAILLAIAACAARPVVVEPVATSPTPHCFALSFAFNGKTETAVACASSAALCANAQRRAVKFGGMMGAREVSTCHVAR
jgi:hypothetical protein